MIGVYGFRPPLVDSHCFDDGPAFEAAIRAGVVTAAIDFAPLEVLSDPNRLTAAALAGIPQVIVLGPAEESPERLDAAGKLIAEMASAARGPTRVIVASDVDAVLVQSLRNWIYPPRLLVESEHASTGDAFLAQCVATLKDLCNC